MSFKPVTELDTDTIKRIRITTESSAVYEFGEADQKQVRSVRKSGTLIGNSVYIGIAELPDQVDPKRLRKTKGAFIGSSPISDGRVIHFVDSINIGDCLGVMLHEETFSGIVSTPIVKIEVEE